VIFFIERKLGFHLLSDRYKDAISGGWTLGKGEACRSSRGQQYPMNLSPNIASVPSIFGTYVQVPAFSTQLTQQRPPKWAFLRDDLLVTNHRFVSYVGALETMIARPNAQRTGRAKFRTKEPAAGKQRGVLGRSALQPI
jgi:hypothetical protein